MTTEQYELLVRRGLLIGPIELLDGRIVVGGHEFIFPHAQAREAAALGVTVRSCVDAVLDDPEARAEIRARLVGYD